MCKNNELYIRIKCKLKILKTMDVLIHYQSLGISMCINNNQLTVTCSKSTIETLFSSYPSARVTQKKMKRGVVNKNTNLKLT